MRKFFAILFLGAVAALAFFCLRIWLRDNRLSNFGERVELYVRPADTAASVIERLDSSGSLLDRGSLERSFRSKKVGEFLKPGHYVVGAGSSSVYAARMLNNGWQTPVRLTLSGNLRIKSNIAAKIASQMLLDSASVLAALEDEELLSRFGASPRTAFCALLPSTYEVYWTDGMEEILSKCKASLDAFWSEENLLKAEALGLDRESAGVLASIVSAESNYEKELPLIAGVYLNRLKVGMPLQADPTVAFCFDYKPRRILKKHLEVDSPYNTYKHAGLPPGPICCPTMAALQAVVNPDFGGEWGRGNLYFCANSDFSGTHVFARTLASHNANARAFQSELTRRTRAGKK